MEERPPAQISGVPNEKKPGEQKRTKGAEKTAKKKKPEKELFWRGQGGKAAAKSLRRKEGTGKVDEFPEPVKEVGPGKVLASRKPPVRSQGPGQKTLRRREKTV